MTGKKPLHLTYILIRQNLVPRFSVRRYIMIHQNFCAEKIENGERFTIYSSI